jgi:hypothetical protein
MSIKFTPAVILYIVALILFLLAAIGGEGQLGTFGIANLGLASLAAGFIMEKWER